MFRPLITPLIVLLVIHAFPTGAAAADEGFVRRVPRPEEVSVVASAASNAMYRFDPIQASRASVFFQKKIEDAGQDKPGRFGGSDAPLPHGMAFLEGIPGLKTVMGARKKAMDSISAIGNNPNRRFVFPFFWFDKKNQKKPSGDSNLVERSTKEKEGAEEGKSERSKNSVQEQYWLGYRLGQLGERKPEEWFLGLGWKSSSGGQKKRNPEEPAEKEFRGPIVGLIGYF